MKRTTAAKRIKTHLNDYRRRLAKDGDAALGTYFSRTRIDCPLCAAVIPWCCSLGCICWPKSNRRLPPDTAGFSCFKFMCHINSLKTVRAKLRWIDKLETELDRWAAEE